MPSTVTILSGGTFEPMNIGNISSDVARNTARDKHSFGLSDFYDTVKANFFQALIAGIINVIVIAVLVFSMTFYYVTKGTVSILGLGLSFAVLFIFVSMGYYMWTLMITFKYTLKQIYSNSFKFVSFNFVLAFKSCFDTLSCMSSFKLFSSSLSVGTTVRLKFREPS